MGYMEITFHYMNGLAARATLRGLWIGPSQSTAQHNAASAWTAHLKGRKDVADTLALAAPERQVAEAQHSNRFTICVRKVCSAILVHRASALTGSFLHRGLPTHRWNPPDPVPQYPQPDQAPQTD